MNKLIFALSVIALCNGLAGFAQKTTTITVKAGSLLHEVFSYSDIFFYPQFMKGKVVLRDGRIAEAKLNYNLLYDEMQYISSKGDTMAIADPHAVKCVAIEKDTFYYNQGYLKLIEGNSNMKLAQKQIWTVKDFRKVGAYDTPSTTASITPFYSYFSKAGRFNLTINEDMLLKKSTVYYFGDSFNNFIPANKKNLLEFLPHGKKNIDPFLKENKVDLNNKEDLEKLVRHLAPEQD